MRRCGMLGTQERGWGRRGRPGQRRPTFCLVTGSMKWEMARQRVLNTVGADTMKKVPRRSG